MESVQRAHIINALRPLRGGLVVSCRARAGNPLHGPASMAMMARAAELGGARGLRVDGVADLTAVLAVTSLPVIAIHTMEVGDSRVTITPTAASAKALIAAGARFVALDATGRPRTGGEHVATIVEAVHAAGSVAIGDLATIDDLPEALAADVDAVGTTLAAGNGQDEPDFAFLARLIRESPVPVYAAGRYWTPEQVLHAFALGAWFVIVGSAIMNPMAITSRFVRAIERAGLESE